MLLDSGRSVGDVGFAFLTDDDLEWAEWWMRDDEYGAIVGWLDCPTDDPATWELDLVEFGYFVASYLMDENFGPEYRRWERVDAIVGRFPRALQRSA